MSPRRWTVSCQAALVASDVFRIALRTSPALVLFGAAGCGGGTVSSDSVRDAGSAMDAGGITDAGPGSDVEDAVALWDGALPPTSVAGSIGGVSPSADDTAYLPNQRGLAGNLDLPGFSVVFSNQVGLCGRIIGSSPYPGESRLWLSVANRFQSLPPTLPSVFPVETSQSAMSTTYSWIGLGTLQYADQTCTLQPDVQATGGTITLYVWSLSTVSGVFDLDFPTGHVSGSFTVPACLPDGSGATGCQ